MASAEQGTAGRRAWLRQLFWTAGVLSLPMGAATGWTVASHLRTPSPWGTPGPLREPDANGIRLPEGWVSRVVAVSGQRPVASQSRLWHTYPDGGATFAAPDGGWVYVSNSEVPVAGGVGALYFNAQGQVVSSQRLLWGTSVNCAGGRTPWGTWLSCEETPSGKVWEVQPFGTTADARSFPALGRFQHEAVAVDPVNRTLYLTEDEKDGRFYRFVCSSTDWPAGASRPALKQGRLQVLRVVGQANNVYPEAGLWVRAQAVEWVDVVQPATSQGIVRKLLGEQAPGTVFKGGEGLWYANGLVYFSTKGDNRIWALDVARQTLEVIYDFTLAQAPDNVLSGVDNLTMTPWGDVLVAEDGGNMDLCLLRPDGGVQVLLQVVGQDQSELTGPAFSPDGRRLYVSSQRGGDKQLGITYEIRRI